MKNLFKINNLNLHWWRLVVVILVLVGLLIAGNKACTLSMCWVESNVALAVLMAAGAVGLFAVLFFKAASK